MIFRKDIQAYRALAVIIVILSHLSVPGFSAGFIGVDLFFVISGYVITALVFNEKLTTGCFDFANFYARRFRRLLPALAFMLLIVFIVCGVFYSPQEQMHQAINGMASSLWLSNMQLAFSQLNYFEPDAKENLFLHTWSLGVEEQFYIVWPLLLLSIVANSISSNQLNFKRTLSLMVIIAIFSFLSSIWLGFTNPIRAYYLMPTRIWQFILGAIAFVLNYQFSTLQIKLDASIKVCIANLGLLIVLLSLIFINVDLLYPGFQAIFPSVGMAVLLFSSYGMNVGWLHKIIELPILQWIGDRSYSLYLWHWPIWLVLSSFGTNDGIEIVLISLIIIVIVAALSFRCIEQPIRRNKWAFSKKATLIFSGTLISFTVYLSSVWFDKAEFWSNDSTVLSVGKYIRDIPVLYKMGCDTDIQSTEIKTCGFGKGESTDNIVLWGDSVGVQWFPALIKIYDQDKWHWNVYTKSACHIVNVTKFYTKLGRNYIECDQWRAKVLEKIKQNPPQVLFFGSALAYFSDEEYLAGLRTILDQFENTPIKIFLLRPTPKLINHPIQCLARQAWINKIYPVINLCERAKESERELNLHMADLLDQVASNYKNVKVIDLNESICPQGVCFLKEGSVVHFRDRLHLTASYVETLSKILAEEIERP